MSRLDAAVKVAAMVSMLVIAAAVLIFAISWRPMPAWLLIDA